MMYTNVLNVCNEIKICKCLKQDSNFLFFYFRFEQKYFHYIKEFKIIDFNNW